MFKVGDRVKIIGPNWATNDNRWVGQTGVVVNIWFSDNKMVEVNTKEIEKEFGNKRGLSFPSNSIVLDKEQRFKDLIELYEKTKDR